jgi:hypothetical protein
MITSDQDTDELTTIPYKKRKGIASS